MMQHEDEFWTHGASAKQILEIIEVFHRFDKSSSPFNLSRLAALRMALPYPLGLDTRRKRRIFAFKYDKTGPVAWLLIRAELNVMARGRRHETSSIFAEIAETAGLLRKRVSADVFRFHETIMTIFRWRMPLMVPQSVKRARKELIPEIVLTAYALTIYDFLRNCVAKKRIAELSKNLAYTVRVHNWKKRDAACSRRIELLHTMNLTKYLDSKPVKGSFRNQQNSHILGQLLIVPVQPVNMNDYEDSFISHQAAFEESFPDGGTVVNGLEVFKSRLKQFSVMLKFVDPNSALKSYFIADFSGIKWSGWTTIESNTDAIFQLTTRHVHRLHAEGLRTQRVEFHIRCPSDQGKELAASEAKGIEIEPMGDSICSLVDIHAFHVADLKISGGIKNVLRLSLGPKYENVASPVFDGVMEVLGYIMLQE